MIETDPVFGMCSCPYTRCWSKSRSPDNCSCNVPSLEHLELTPLDALQFLPISSVSRNSSAIIVNCSDFENQDIIPGKGRNFSATHHNLICMYHGNFRSQNELVFSIFAVYSLTFDVSYTDCAAFSSTETNLCRANLVISSRVPVTWGR